MHKLYFAVFLSFLQIFVSCKQEDKPIEPEVPTAPTSYSRLTGDTADVSTQTSSGVCLMGGSTDVDEAFKWMIKKSGGGDFVVIRTDVSFGYNAYIRGLGTVNSVETIIITNKTEADYASNAKKIRNAEALFIAGGDQAEYVDFWKNTKVEDAVNYLINVKHVPVGGTSAGCAILGSSYFSAIKGGLTSSEALQNPYNSYVTLGHDDFINIPLLQNTITDQHFSQRGREGRFVTFLARMKKDLNKNPRGIAVDEQTAVCVDETGKAIVFGNNNAFFAQCNELEPEICQLNTPLSWNREKKAVKVYRIPGSASGNGSFDLNDYTTCSGGVWFYWYAEKGTLFAE